MREEVPIAETGDKLKSTFMSLLSQNKGRVNCPGVVWKAVQELSSSRQRVQYRVGSQSAMQSENI